MPTLQQLRRRLNVAVLVGLFGAGLLSTELWTAITAQTQDLMVGNNTPAEQTDQVDGWVAASRAGQEAGPPKGEQTTTTLNSLAATQAILDTTGDAADKTEARQPKIAPVPKTEPKTEPAKATTRAAAVPAVTVPKQQASRFSGGNIWQTGSFPVENFQSYTSAFGYRGSGGRWEFHRGLDLAAPKGSYIRNWWAGKVIKISDGDRCGTAVRIQSGNWQHVYCHLKGRAGTRNGRRYLKDPGSGLEIWEGQRVQTGTRIGRVGMTGRTTGPHLHWGIKYGKDWIDPALVLRAMYSSRF